MRAKVKTKINSIQRLSDGSAIISIEAATPGKVETKAMNAKEIFFKGEISLRQLVADDIKIGAVITITLTDEESANEGID